MTKDVSVVIPTYERPRKLLRTIDSVKEQSVEGYEVLIADDGSSSDSQAQALSSIQKSYPDVIVLRGENRGPAAARNLGWKTASGELIFFTDDDCLVPHNWIERLTSSFEPGIGAVGGPLLPPENVMAQNSFARLYSSRSRWVYRVPQATTVGGSNLPMGGTGNIAYRREALDKVGGFDESFPVAAGEDADLQTRVVDAGYRVKFVDIVVEHLDDFTARSFLRRSIRHGAGTYYYRRRHGEVRSPLRVSVGLVASPLFTLTFIYRGAGIEQSVLLAIDRMLNRWGELLATLSSL